MSMFDTLSDNQQSEDLLVIFNYQKGNKMNGTELIAEISTKAGITNFEAGFVIDATI